MLVFTDLLPPLGTLSLVWVDVSLEAVSVSSKGASATKHFQNPSPSDLKTGAFPKQCHGPDINSDTSSPFLGGKKGTYFNTTLSRRLLCVQQLSGHCLPQNQCPFVSPSSPSTPQSCCVWLRTSVMTQHCSHSTRILCSAKGVNYFHAQLFGHLV